MEIWQGFPTAVRQHTYNHVHNTHSSPIKNNHYPLYLWNNIFLYFCLNWLIFGLRLLHNLTPVIDKRKFLKAVTMITTFKFFSYFHNRYQEFRSWSLRGHCHCAIVFTWVNSVKNQPDLFQLLCFCFFVFVFFHSLHLGCHLGAWTSISGTRSWRCAGPTICLHLCVSISLHLTLAERAHTHRADRQSVNNRWIKWT